ncbi:hypothetical protein K4L44_01305 [Halosquirtibacter laminarini]|uniref:Uncharacterized protein n=1 Tax=Halosquirtibacter laminarini TaxID=3374600 RepID=A0AC61NL31_9BACT|nr:hypothetical protein K4L44_01305 [Prolixibacteraceae bacterium]
MRNFLVLYLILGTFIISCRPFNQSDETQYVATIGKYKLKQSDISKLLPTGLDSLDSVRFVDNFKQQWLRQKLLVIRAEKTLTLDEMDMRKKLEEYRENLLIYRLEKRYIEQNLDTLIPSDLSLKYYESHKAKFKLSKPIVKAVIVQVPSYAADPDEIMRLLMSKDSNDFLSLESYCFRYATKYDDFNNDWVSFDVIERFFKDDFLQPKKFFQRNRYYQQLDSTNFRCVYLNQFMDVGDNAPYEYSKKNVSALILNERKQKLLRKLDSLTYDSAVKNGELKQE